MPYFSVVIPTYNRAHLIPMAVKSVLHQSFEDFEIVISDGGSTDQTSDVVNGLNDPRIQYIRSETRLSAGDNYQTGLDNAAGEYITFLSDDDAYSPSLLARAKELIDNEKVELIGYPSCRYYHDDLVDQDLRMGRNTLFVPEHSGAVTRFDSTDARHQVRAYHGISERPLHAGFICPFLANNVYHRSLFDRLKGVRSKLFHSVPADIYLAMAIFYVAEEYHCLDVPLHIWSNWAGNATASPTRTGNAIREHYEKLLGDKQLEFTPLKFALPLNCGVNAILEASSEFGKPEEDRDVSWEDYYLAIYTDLMSLKRSGINVNEELAEFWSGLSREPQRVRTTVESGTKSLIFKLKEVSRNFPTASRRIKKMLGVGRVSEGIHIKGDDAGFSDVFECSQYADRMFQPDGSAASA